MTIVAPACRLSTESSLRQTDLIGRCVSSGQTSGNSNEPHTLNFTEVSTDGNAKNKRSMTQRNFVVLVVVHLNIFKHLHHLKSTITKICPKETMESLFISTDTTLCTPCCTLYFTITHNILYQLLKFYNNNSFMLGLGNARASLLVYIFTKIRVRS